MNDHTRSVARWQPTTDLVSQLIQRRKHTDELWRQYLQYCSQSLQIQCFIYAPRRGVHLSSRSIPEQAFVMLWAIGYMTHASNTCHRWLDVPPPTPLMKYCLSVPYYLSLRATANSAKRILITANRPVCLSVRSFHYVMSVFDERISINQSIILIVFHFTR